MTSKLAIAASTAFLKTQSGTSAQQCTDNSSRITELQTEIAALEARRAQLLAGGMISGASVHELDAKISALKVELVSLQPGGTPIVDQFVTPSAVDRAGRQAQLHDQLEAEATELKELSGKARADLDEKLRFWRNYGSP